MVQSSTMEGFSRQNQSQNQNRLQSDSNMAMSRQSSQTLEVPSFGYLGLAIGSMVASALLAVFANRKEFANFVGLWAPSFLLIGIYNKLSQLEKSDNYSSQKRAA